MSEEKVMQSLLLDYSKAIETTQTMATAIEELNKQLSVVQGAAKKASSGINDVFKTSGDGSMASSMGKTNNEIDAAVEKMREFGLVTKKTSIDADDNITKLTVSAKNLENHLEIIKNFKMDEGTLKELGSVEIDTSEMEEYKKGVKELERLDKERLKNQKELAKEADRIAKASRKEIDDRLKSEAREIDSIKQSTLAKLDGQAASIQQRVVTKGISDEYSEQAKEIRSQIALLQEKLEISGKLSLEEAKQAKELQEKTKVLQGQVQAAGAEKTASGGILESEFQRRLGWFFTGSVTFGAINAIKEVVSTFKEVEMGVTEIARVMNDSSFVFKEYRDNLLALGVEYGQTFDVVQNIALRWAQSGYSTADSLELARTSLLALNTAELDARNATESMIGIMAQWQLEAGEMELVMDKINKTADNYTITSQDLVDGLLRSSGAARVMNVSLDETIGLLTVMREASGRTGREVGNALNSILSYIQRPSAINTFERLGINVFADEAKTQFRNAMEIFGEIAVNWGSLSADIQDGFVQSAMDAELFNEELAEALGMQEEWNSLQQRDVTQAAAGIYRRNYFIGMIERMSNVQGVLNGLMTAEGYSMRENERTMNTLEKQTQSLSASMEMLAVAMGDAGVLDLMKQMAAGGANLAMVLAKLPPELRDMVFGFGTLMTMMTAVQAGAKMMGKEINLLGLSFATLKTGLDGVAAAVGRGMAALAANPLTWIAGAVALLVTLYNAHKRANEEKAIFIEKTQDNIINLEKEKAELITLSKEYETLKEKQNNLTANVDEKERLLDVQNELVEKYGVSISGITAEGKAYADSTEAIQDRIDALNTMIEADRKALEMAVDADRTQRAKTVGKYSSRAAEIEEELKRLDELKAEAERIMGEGGIFSHIYDDGLVVTTDASTEEGLLTIKSFVDGYSKEWNRLYKELGESRENVEQETAAMHSLLLDYALEIANDLTKEGKVVTDEARLFAKNMAKTLSFEDLSAAEAKSKLEKYMGDLMRSGIDKTAEQYKKALSEGNEKTLKLISQYMVELARSLSDGSEYAEEFINAIERKFPPTLEAASKSVFDLTASIDRLKEAYQKITSDVKELNSAMDTISKGESLSAEATLALIDKYDDLIESVEKTTDGYRIEISVLEKLRADKIKTAQDTATEEINAAQIAIDSTKSKLAAYGLEIDAVKDLTEAYGILYRTISQQVDRDYTHGSSDAGIRAGLINQEIEKLLGPYREASAEMDRLLLANQQREELLKQLGLPTNKGGSGSGGKQESELARAYKLLEHHKKITEDSVELAQWELNELKEIQKKYGDIMTEDERMTMIEKLYAAEKRLNDMRAKATEESLKQEQNAFSQREDYIKHWTTLGIININQQIEKYKELYTITAKSAAEEMKRTENLFSLYKKQLTEQKNAIKSAYDDRINQIKEQAELEKNVHQDKIAGIEKELALLSEEESDYDYERKMADLYEELAYWQVRVSEDARKKEAETIKKIEDAKYKREMELKKKGLEDTKKVANDEIRAIDDAAKAETEKWKAAYDTTMDYFDDHAISIIATAELMGERAFDAMQRTYFEPMKRALRESSVEDFSVVGGSFGSGITDMAQSQSAKRGEIKTIAQMILALKKEWTDGDKSAATRATSLYEKLSGLDPTVANMLHQMDYLTAREYVNNLPEMHTGGKTLSYGAVYMKPGELVFPPNLSMKLEGLMNFLERNPVYSDKKTNNEEVKQVIVNGNLFNSEKTVFNDEVDMAIMSRELQRALLNM